MAPALERYALAAKEAGVPRDYLKVLVDAGIVLQPRQLQFAAACAACDRPDGPTEVGFGGARGGGKSHAALAVLAADCLRYPGLTCLLLRKVGKANRQNFSELRRKVLRGVSTTWKQQEGILLFANGSQIVLGHFQNENDIDAYLGLEYDVILTEEATTLSESKYSGVRTCNRSSKPGWRPRMYSTTNPGGVGHAWYKRRFILPVREGKNGPTRFVFSTVRDNRCVNREYTAVLEQLTGWQKRAWLDGDWDIAAGQYFTSFRTALHVAPAPNPVRGVHRAGLSFDYGFSHWSVFTLLVKIEGIVYVRWQVAGRRQLPGQLAPQVHARLRDAGLSASDLSFCVAGHDVFAQKGDERARTIADQYREEGLHFTPAKIDRISGAAELLARLGDADGTPPIPSTLRIDPGCAGLIECLPALQHDPHRPEDVLKADADDEGKGGDDWYDSLRYGLMEMPAGSGWSELAGEALSASGGWGEW